MRKPVCFRKGKVERVVGELKSAGVEFFAGVPVKVLYGYHCTDGAVHLALGTPIIGEEDYGYG